MIDETTNNTALITATFFSFHSNDFLLPYSLEPLAPHIPIHIHHLGDISTIAQTKTAPETIMIIFSSITNIF
jgi:hypothetical protein